MRFMSPLSHVAVRGHRVEYGKARAVLIVRRSKSPLAAPHGVQAGRPD